MNNDREDLTFTTLSGASATGGDPHQTFIVEHQERRGSLDDDGDDGNDDIDTGELRDQDRFLPIANVARIMKKAIPSQVKWELCNEVLIISVVAEIQRDFCLAKTRCEPFFQGLYMYT